MGYRLFIVKNKISSNFRPSSCFIKMRLSSMWSEIMIRSNFYRSVSKKNGNSWLVDISNLDTRFLSLKHSYQLGNIAMKWAIKVNFEISLLIWNIYFVSKLICWFPSLYWSFQGATFQVTVCFRCVGSKSGCTLGLLHNIFYSLINFRWVTHIFWKIECP